jgi:hypothetical protein
MLRISPQGLKKKLTNDTIRTCNIHRSGFEAIAHLYVTSQARKHTIVFHMIGDIKACSISKKPN